MTSNVKTETCRLKGDIQVEKEIKLSRSDRIFKYSFPSETYLFSNELTRTILYK